MNYKGIYFDDDPNNKYTCPKTGAHFEHTDMCGRLQQVIKWRKVYEQKIAALALSGKGHQGIAQVFVEPEDIRMSSKERKEQLQLEKEEFMKKMGVLDNHQAAKNKKKSSQ